MFSPVFKQTKKTIKTLSLNALTFELNKKSKSKLLPGGYSQRVQQKTSCLKVMEKEILMHPDLG